MYNGIFVDRATIATGFSLEDGRDLGTWATATQARRAIERLIPWLATHIGDGDIRLSDGETGETVWRCPIGSDGVAVLSVAWLK